MSLSLLSPVNRCVIVAAAEKRRHSSLQTMLQMMMQLSHSSVVAGVAVLLCILFFFSSLCTDALTVRVCINCRSIFIFTQSNRFACILPQLIFTHSFITLHSFVFVTSLLLHQLTVELTLFLLPPVTAATDSPS